MPKTETLTSRPGVVGAAIVPHAPQFLTLPETEDRAQVARVNAAMREIGDRFRALLVALDREALRTRFALNPMLLYQLENRLK